MQIKAARLKGSSLRKMPPYKNIQLYYPSVVTDPRRTVWNSDRINSDQFSCQREFKVAKDKPAVSVRRQKTVSGPTSCLDQPFFLLKTPPWSRCSPPDAAAAVSDWLLLILGVRKSAWFNATSPGGHWTGREASPRTLNCPDIQMRTRPRRRGKPDASLQTFQRN